MNFLVKIKKKGKVSNHMITADNTLMATLKAKELGSVKSVRMVV